MCLMPSMLLESQWAYFMRTWLGVSSARYVARIIVGVFHEE